MNQKYVLANCGSTPSIRPKAHGINIVRISTATPRVAICHMTMVIRPPNVISGVLVPGFSLRHSRQVNTKPQPSIQLPTTTRVNPT